VASGKISAAEVARLAFDAIRDGDFYIFPHPQTLESVRTRMEDILGRRNPSDPFAASPQLRAALKAKLNIG
jgi:hypothetical protein